MTATKQEMESLRNALAARNEQDDKLHRETQNLLKSVLEISMSNASTLQGLLLAVESLKVAGPATQKRAVKAQPEANKTEPNTNGTAKPAKSAKPKAESKENNGMKLLQWWRAQCKNADFYDKMVASSPEVCDYLIKEGVKTDEKGDLHKPAAVLKSYKFLKNTIAALYAEQVPQDTKELVADEVTDEDL